MSQSIKLSKKSENNWLHTITINGQVNEIYDPNVSVLMANNVLSISVGLDSVNKNYQNFKISEVIVQDDSTGGGEETFTTLNALSIRLDALLYIGF